MFRLDHLNGPNKGKRRIVERRRYDAGSDLSCQIWAPAEQGMAPRHAEFEDDGESVRIQAIEGASLCINGRTVKEAKLHEGDRIDIGPVALRFSRRRRRARDYLWLPFLGIFIAALGYIGGQMLRQWRSHRAAAERETERETLSTLRQASVETAEFRTMETIAERIETTDAEHIERVRHDLEQDRDRPSDLSDARNSLSPDRISLSLSDDEALSAARKLAAEGRAREAEAAFERLLKTRPDFAEARAEHARWLEEQRRPGDALLEWQKLLDLGPSSHWHAVAAGEVMRLGRVATPPSPPPGTAVEVLRPAPPPTPAPPPSKLRFEAIEHRRFPASADYEEMRIVRAIVAPTPQWRSEELARARVEFVFYDLPEGQSAAAPTRARTTSNPLWLRDAPRDEAGRWIVTASYIVPRGLRERERRATGRTFQYHGFLVQAFVGDQWQATEARPRALAERRVSARTP